MIRVLKKYASLMMITFFLIIPVIPRAKVIWFLFLTKQSFLRFTGRLGGNYGRE